MNAVDDYLGALPEPQRSTLSDLRAAIHAAQPGLTESISYGVPAFLHGRTRVAGFSAHARHLSYLPHSGSLLATLADELRGFKVSKGAFQFPIDEPLPRELVATLVHARIAEG